MVLTGTTRGAKPVTFAPMLDESAPQTGDSESLHGVVQATTPMEGDFAPLEVTSAPMWGEAASLQGAFAPIQGGFARL